MYVPRNILLAAWLEEIGKRGSDRPIVSFRYIHTLWGIPTGTSIFSGKPFYKYPNLQGAYIWDWVDQGHGCSGRTWTPLLDIWPVITVAVDMPSDGNFNCNGLINPDRTPHPAHGLR